VGFFYVYTIMDARMRIHHLKQYVLQNDVDTNTALLLKKATDFVEELNLLVFRQRHLSNA
jgi:hypothetical protein